MQIAVWGLGSGGRARVYTGFRDEGLEVEGLRLLRCIAENQMEKKMDNEMGTGVTCSF